MAPASTENTDHVRSETGSFLQRNRSGVGFRADAENNINISSTFAAGCQLKKKKSQPESRVVFFGRNVKDSELGRQHLSSPEKTAPGRWEVESGYIQVCNKGSRQSEHQRLL